MQLLRFKLLIRIYSFSQKINIYTHYHHQPSDLNPIKTRQSLGCQGIRYRKAVEVDEKLKCRSRRGRRFLDWKWFASPVDRRICNRNENIGESTLQPVAHSKLLDSSFQIDSGLFTFHCGKKKEPSEINFTFQIVTFLCIQSSQNEISFEAKKKKVDVKIWSILYTLKNEIRNTENLFCPWRRRSNVTQMPRAVYAENRKRYGWKWIAGSIVGRISISYASAPVISYYAENVSSFRYRNYARAEFPAPLGKKLDSVIVHHWSVTNGNEGWFVALFIREP